MNSSGAMPTTSTNATAPAAVAPDSKTGPPPLPAPLQTAQEHGPFPLPNDPQTSVPAVPSQTRSRGLPTMRDKRAKHRHAKAVAKASLPNDDSDTELNMALFTDSSEDDPASDYHPTPRGNRTAGLHPSPSTSTSSSSSSSSSSTFTAKIKDEFHPRGPHGSRPRSALPDLPDASFTAAPAAASPILTKKSMIIPGTLLRMEIEFFCGPCKAKGLQNALFQTEARTTKHILTAAHHKHVSELLASNIPLVPEYRTLLANTLKARAQADDANSLAARMMAQWELIERNDIDPRALHAHSAALPAPDATTTIAKPAARLEPASRITETHRYSASTELATVETSSPYMPHAQKERYLAYLLATSTARDSGTSEEEIVLKQWTDELWIKYHEGTLNVADNLPGMCTLCSCEMKHEGNVKTHGKGKKHRGNCKKLLQEALQADEDTASYSPAMQSNTNSSLGSSYPSPMPSGRGRGRGPLLKRGRSPTRSTERPAQKQKSEVTLGFDCYKCKERITVPKNGKRTVFCANCGGTNDVPRF